MLCAEENRLRKVYDDALHRWARVQAGLSHFASPPPRIKILILEMADERNAAWNRWEMHRRNCSRCGSKEAASGI